jgi:hypothetical protein
VVAFGREDQGPRTGDLGDGGRPPTATRTALDPIEKPTALLAPAQADERLGRVSHDRFPVHRCQPAEPRLREKLCEPLVCGGDVAERVVEHRERHLDADPEPRVGR